MPGWRPQWQKLWRCGLPWASQPWSQYTQWDVSHVWKQQVDADVLCRSSVASCCVAALNTSGWAEGLTSMDFELLCADGRRAPLSHWESCNLGVIPPNTVMTRPILTARVYDFLVKSQVGAWVRFLRLNCSLNSFYHYVCAHNYKTLNSASPLNWY